MNDDIKVIVEHLKDNVDTPASLDRIRFILVLHSRAMYPDGFEIRCRKYQG